MLNTPPPGPRRSAGLLVTAVALVVVAAGFLVWSVVSLGSAGSDLDAANAKVTDANSRLDELNADGDLAFAGARDEADRHARHAMAVMNTLDYRKLDEGLADWARVTTGALHDQVTAVSDEQREAIVDGRSVTTAEVFSSAVRELDDRAGTAVVIAAVRIDVAAGDQPATQKWQRMEGQLTRTGSAWLLESIRQVPVG